MDQDVQCFAGSSTVETPEGRKSITEVQVGDQILGRRGGQDAFVTVDAWIHKVVDAEWDVVQITTSAGNVLQIAAEHILPVNTSTNFVR